MPLIFHPEIIVDCPPADAKPADRPIYRKIAGKVVTAKDFESDVESKTRHVDPGNCHCWGCSIWCDEESVTLALDLFPYWKKRYIVVGTPAAEHGVLRPTPSKDQPGHYTFWRAVGVEIPGAYEIFCGPEEA